MGEHVSKDFKIYNVSPRPHPCWRLSSGRSFWPPPSTYRTRKRARGGHFRNDVYRNLGLAGVPNASRPTTLFLGIRVNRHSVRRGRHNPPCTGLSFPGAASMGLPETRKPVSKTHSFRKTASRRPLARIYPHDEPGKIRAKLPSAIDPLPIPFEYFVRSTRKHARVTRHVRPKRFIAQGRRLFRQTLRARGTGRFRGKR